MSSRRKNSTRLLRLFSSVFVVVLILAAILQTAAFAAFMVKAAGTSAKARSSISVFVEPQAGIGPVTSLIGSARHFVRLELYELTDDDLVNALVKARNRQVTVQVMLEQHPDGGARYATRAYSELRKDGIQVKWANESRFTYTHEKAMDVDDRVAGIFTFNWSYSAFETNREFGVVDRDSHDARRVGDVFESDWRRKRASLHTGRLAISPINSRTALTSLIRNARHSLDLYEEEMSDTSMEDALIAAAKRHVSVRLITSDDGSGVNRIRGGGVHVRILSSPYIHAKAIVADGSKTFIGSENISSTSLDRNREMGIILTGQKSAQIVQRQFQADWVLAAG